jgi:hypothetical protein
MLVKSYFSLLLVLVFSAANACAGTCVGSQNICGAYSDAEAAVTAKLVKIEGSLVDDKYQGQTLDFEVERSFKGLKEKTFQVFQVNTSVTWWYRDKDIGKTLLLYLYKQKEKNFYNILQCSRSGEADKSTDALSWLEKLPGSLERNRISGTLWENNTWAALSNVGVKISNSKNSYDLVTDKNGMFEIWDVVPGDYSIVSQKPSGLSLFWNEAATTTVEAKGCGGGNIVFTEKREVRPSV